MKNKTRITKKSKPAPSTEKLSSVNLKNLYEFCERRYNKNGSSNWLQWAVEPVSADMKTEYVSADGQALSVIGYHPGTKQRVVEFPDGIVVNASLDALRRGSVAHPFAKTVAGIGYHGIGAFYSLAGAQRWDNIIRLSNHEGHKPVAPEWHCRADFLEWFVPRHERAQKAHPGERWELESDFYSYLTGHAAVYSPGTTFLVPQVVNSSLRDLGGLSKAVKALLNGESTKLPRGLSLDSAASRLIVTLDSIRWGSFKNCPEGLLQGLELLSRLKVYRLLLQMASYSEVLDPLLPQLVQSLHEQLFGQLQLDV